MKQTLKQRNTLRFKQHAFTKIRKQMQKELPSKPRLMQIMLQGVADRLLSMPIQKAKANLIKSYLKSVR